MFADITDEGLKQIATLRGLRRLSLNSPRVTDAGMAHLTALPHLEHVELRAAHVSDETLKHLAEIKTLKRLDLYGRAAPGVQPGGNFTSEGFQQLKTLPKLRTVWLTGVVLDDGFDGLKELTQLRVLAFVMSNIRGGDIDALEDALPHTTVYVTSGGGTRTPNKMRTAPVGPM